MQMRVSLAMLIWLLCLIMVLGYMSGEAQAATAESRVAVSKAKARATADKVKASVKRLPNSKADRRIAIPSQQRSVQGARIQRAAYQAPAALSYGRALGLHQSENPLDLKSSVALVVDQASGSPLFEKNADAVLPIASISKLMTALVVTDARLPLDEEIEISQEDIDTEKHTSSRLRPGTRLTREDALHLALMASENRAASALGRHYPGGLPAFVQAMNAKAAALGMRDTRFVEPTGLSSSNQSSARDLARMVMAAYRVPLIRDFTTSPAHSVQLGARTTEFHNTNRLVDRPDWSIGVQKTGYISEAGQCLVMQATIDARPVVMVLLDAQGKYSRFGDAGRIRDWLVRHPAVADSPLTTAPKSAAVHPG
ncbi:D-alanyl-D-alanine endopeptidase [Derxia lacustris]|uniref:D-alanyl-D-alanine endopeptidase n=1 Tax=Derxia lacustris TaxID=764842 RepID=UPI000A174C43|nr:D-alanyl-D-alanine endopeptidase [Derxia lacustris]